MRSGLFFKIAIVVALFTGSLAACAQESATEPIPDSNPDTQRHIHYVANEMYVPIMNAMPRGLDVLEVYADLPGKHPLALLTHGTSVDKQERMRVTPWAQYNQALWFARRGFVVLVVVRKGYGRSSGVQDNQSGGCNSHGSFKEAGEASADELGQVVHWAASRAEIDVSTIVSAGVSTGGFAQVALSADPPKGLKAAISFAGGRGSDGKEHNCNLDGLLRAFQSYGKDAAKHGSLPMLWIYSENDHYFPAAMATRFDEAYRKGGGADEFVMNPPNGDDGHHLYSHLDAWSNTVGAFLKAHGLLPLGEELLPLPTVPDEPAPAGLHDHGLEVWKRFLAGAPFKAFATNGDGIWGLSAGAFDQAIADQQAVDRCKKAAGANASRCQVAARTPGVK